MLSFVQSWFAPTANPIGVDFGSDSLRLAQVDSTGGEFKLVAAARTDVPAHLKSDPAGKLSFFTENVRELLTQGNFRGRRVVLSMPASAMSIQHLRMAKMDEAALKSALPWECRGKLPYDPSHALMRHIVAGEVFADGEQKSEVIVMAAQREWVNQFLAAAAKAKLDVVGMNVEPKALIDCFSHVYRRKSDQESVNLFVDIGAHATRAVVARAGDILFARAIQVGGEHFTRAVANHLKINAEDARILRAKLCHAQLQTELNRSAATPAPVAEGRNIRGENDISGVGSRFGAESPSCDADAPQDSNAGDCRDAERVNLACAEPVGRLVQELNLCRRYHEATFPNAHITRLIFVGGEARHRSLCQTIAREMDLAAQVGDPMVRMARTTDVGPESGIDRRLPQPDWAVALGLSMGPQGVPAAATATAAKA
ncbi:pilus assembly protein PilM [Humisphaera borealis]|uniref:Pilus assembly protein PilM n=1 Tax=Humisphaera borealis TaxID=2807512 RepID=A0A7M2WY22_9BACT|nr:pilus assembly protein PilM [Humisphaera borealis]QOV90122.1 pilus assembly protein PilM [Humisphaera borealis]